MSARDKQLSNPASWLRRASKASPFQVLPRQRWAEQRATYRDADPAIIDSALARTLRRPGGNWYVFAAGTDIRTRPFGATVAGNELVAWRDDQQGLHVGPAACPHLGADLCTGSIDRGSVVCPWHGLRLTGRPRTGWEPFPAYDDGVLAWVRLDHVGDEAPTQTPVLPQRPAQPRIAAVARTTGVCEPRDVIANRMDPWHGAWFHPYSFTRLEVLDAPPADGDNPDPLDRFVVAVTFRVGRFGVPVIAEFTSPEPRTIVMHIVEGEGAGSVVETHATPVGPGIDGRPRTTVIEAVIAHSERPGFVNALRASGLVVPFMRYAANRLWRDDLAYAERLYALRAASVE
ncbi:DUF5914 domain-containing protein [Mycolicibacterium mengxianglii]|uniref:DUF5914 domain-containing protein n=1 Tax=Mycolicibacterium mengxianglii TaxID=2736649 RepID=UPI001E572B2F|nr:DUF5914 domain-containing protein [Mycolicibacterium mengxianglii]